MHRDGDVVRLEDAKSQTSVSIMPSRGNSAFRMRVKGKDVLRFPYASVEEYLKGGGRGMSGIPFLGPWANRLDETAFYANGKKYPFNMELGNVRPGPEQSPDPRLSDERFAMAGGRGEVRPQCRMGDEPARVLPAAGMDGAVPVRPHHRDDVSPAGRRARGAHETRSTSAPSRCP